MRIKNATKVGLLATGLLLLTSSAVQAQEGERFGKKLDDAASAIRRGVGRASDTVRDQFDKAKASINAMGIEGRVYGRIRWDKSLEGATFDVTVAKDGTTTLEGTVPTAAGKLKAVTLASETTGVTQVVDKLTVAETATTTP